MREHELIAWITSRADFDETVEVGPGDDCAVLRCGGRTLLVTTDQVLDGVHLHVADDGWRAAGRKALARNLSDIAAMAGTPAWAVVSAVLPRGTTDAQAHQIQQGLWETGEAFGCAIVGGDLASWDGPLQVGVTVIGTCDGEPVLRSGARPGDALCVTGRLGGSLASGRHLTFTPRVREALALRETCELHAMIDLSDGLSTDLGHLCAASGVGAEIEAEAVPIHEDVLAAGSAEDALAAALSDGEDYELLLALPAEQAEAIAARSPIKIPVTTVGTVRAGGEITLRDLDGRARPLAPGGWEHRT